MSVLLDKDWHLHHGDCVEHLAELTERCFDLSVYSPPFPAIFAYTSSPADIGNVDDVAGEGKLQLSFFYRNMLRVMKPGRVMVVHVTQIHKNKRDGEQGMYDFRGMNIRLAERAGFLFDYDWLIRKNPQAQAIRTHKWELKFQGLESDRTVSRGALGDYLLKFRAPGKNEIPVDSEGEVSRNNWIEWAECCWNVRNDTLNKEEGRGEKDVKHIAPLQLDIIERIVRLYSNPGEIVFSPFAGIGSECYTALKCGRKAYGCELKTEYFNAAIKNMGRAEAELREQELSLFSGEPS